MSMEMALEYAQKAAALGEVPVGAVVVHMPTGRVVAGAHNLVEHKKNTAAHAEMLALDLASKALGEKYLVDCALYVTLEPCAMCAAAIAFARIHTLTFGAYDPKGGAVEYGGKFFSQTTCHHAPNLIGGVMESTCSNLLKDFFASKRG